MKNTIIVIQGPSGHEYVAHVGSSAVVTTELDDALSMTNEEAYRAIAKINLPAELHDLDWFRVRMGRENDVNARLEAELLEVIE
jgi:hypothetical protein